MYKCFHMFKNGSYGWHKLVYVSKHVKLQVGQFFPDRFLELGIKRYTNIYMYFTFPTAIVDAIHPGCHHKQTEKLTKMYTNNI